MSNDEGNGDRTERAAAFRGWSKAQIQNLMDQVNRIETKLDTFGDRVGVVENWKSGLTAQLRVMVFVVPPVMTLLVTWLKDVLVK